MPSNTKLQFSFTSKKLSWRFNIKDKTKFQDKNEVIILGTYAETTRNDNYYTSELIRPNSGRSKDHNGRDIKSHLLKHALAYHHAWSSAYSKEDFK